MAVDRQYVLAAFTGLLFEQSDYGLFALKYEITQEEKRSCAEVAIMSAMQGGGHFKDPEKSKAFVAELARRFNIDEDRLANLAWKVVRGSMGEQEWELESLQIIGFTVSNFLARHVPDVPCFGYTGTLDSFNPPEAEHSGAVVADFVFHDIYALGPNEDGADLPEELLHLYRDAGIIS